MHGDAKKKKLKWSIFIWKKSFISSIDLHPMEFPSLINIYWSLMSMVHRVSPHKQWTKNKGLDWIYDRITFTYIACTSSFKCVLIQNYQNNIQKSKKWVMVWNNIYIYPREWMTIFNPMRCKWDVHNNKLQQQRWR
jgi:hypothetical protein